MVFIYRENIKNILICLERLEIGGVETAVVNQVNNLINKGYKVVVLSKTGIYKEKLESEGATCIEFSFDIDDNFNLEKVYKVTKILKDYNIDEVHINQLPCILSVVPACLINNIPYIAYCHSEVGGVYEWFMNTYKVFEIAIPSYYRYAHKIIAITNKVKQDIIDRFNINEDKIKVIHNSIIFKEDEQDDVDNKYDLERFLIISRFAKEKEQSIYNAIDFFKEYQLKNDKASLFILGDGEIKQNILNYAKESGIEDKITFLGSCSNVLEKIKQADLVLGLGRCILEAISVKKLAISIGYEELKELIVPDNIAKASEENFSGGNLESKTKNELVDFLQNLTEEEIIDITQKNYEYAKEYLNIDKNFYVIGEDETIEKLSSMHLVEMLIELESYIKELNNKNNIEINKLTEQNAIEKEHLNEEIKRLEQELSVVYSSKRWKIRRKTL